MPSESARLASWRDRVGVARRLAGRPAAQRRCSAGVSRLFNRRLRPRDRRVYAQSVGVLLRVSVLVLLVYGGLLVPDLRGVSRRRRPASFPRRTRAICWSTCSCPTPRRSSGRDEVMQQIEEIAGEDAGRQAHRRHRRPVDPAQRQRAELRRDVRDARRLSRARRRRSCPADAIAARLQSELAGRDRRTGMVNVFGAPPVEGLGTAGGFKIVIEDRGDAGLDGAARRRPTASSADGNDTPELQDLFTSFRANTPWLYLDIDRTQAKTHGRVDGRGLQHAAGLPRLALRQRLQPLRPHLAGQRAGRRRLPQAGRGPQAAQGAQRPGRDGAVRRARQRARRERAR